MRLSLFFLMLILLPVAAVAHALFLEFYRLPGLREEALSMLQQAGVRDAQVKLHFLDVDIAGEAPDLDTYRKVLQSIQGIGALRLRSEANRLHVSANVESRLDDQTLHVQGWLPEQRDITDLTKLLTELRPDLTLVTTDLQHAPEVRWPADFKSPLNAESAILQPILETLHVPAELRVDFQSDTILLTGILPSNGLREEIIAAIAERNVASVIDPAGLKSSPHVREAPFAKKSVLAAFLRSFFAAPPPRHFEIHDTGNPKLSGAATRQMESDWLALLRPVTGAAKVEAQITVLPSVYHFPGYQPKCQLPAATLTSIRELLQHLSIQFEEGSSRIPAAAQTELAAVASSLLAAGPALSLVIGGHTAPSGNIQLESTLAKSRADAVLSFLIEQGVPAAEITSMAFEPVSPNSAAAPSQPRSVEILVK